MILAKPALDLGIVTTDAEGMLCFYRDTLALEDDGEVPYPGVGVIKRLACGESVIKILVLDEAPPARASADGMTSQTGYRYCTLTVADLDAVVEACRKAGHPIPVEIRDLRPGVRVAMVQDPDGNTVELIGA